MCHMQDATIFAKNGQEIASYLYKHFSEEFKKKYVETVNLNDDDCPRQKHNNCTAIILPQVICILKPQIIATMEANSSRAVIEKTTVGKHGSTKRLN